MADTITLGWRVDPDDRTRLLAALPPRYETVVADHVTLRTGVEPGTPDPPPVRGEVVGVADDGQGVQALVVRVDGTMHRPGGGTFHITWSLGPGREAVESNDVIAAQGWLALPRRHAVGLIPAHFP
jgi:hypothetical protein